MANISAIKLPDGVTYNIVDRVSKDVFVAECGVTSYSDVYDAYVAHKQIILKYPLPNDYFYTPCSAFCSGAGSSIYLWFLFAWPVPDSFATCVELTSNNNWSVNNTALQDELVSGTNIKTINNTSLLGSGNITVTANGTSTPTADEIAEFDSSAKMNSTNMSSAEVTTFVSSLDIDSSGNKTLIKLVRW